MREASTESISDTRLNYQPFHKLYQEICEEAAFDESAYQSIFDVLDSTDDKRSMNPLAFTQEVLPHRLSSVLAASYGTKPTSEGLCFTELFCTEQHASEQ